MTRGGFAVFFILLCAYCCTVFAQAKSERWQKQTGIYQSKEHIRASRDYTINTGSLSEIIAKPLLIAYWVLISDADGDLCPFEPSCSSFFLQAVRAGNLVEGTLLFADRFTRDANLYNRFAKYPFDYRRAKFLDPVERYLKMDDESPKGVQ